jgi:hypothetical protein
MNRRSDRVTAFRRAAGASWFHTSLQPVGAHRQRDNAAIRNWYLREPIAKPTCFACRAPFTAQRRPRAFLTAVASRSPQAGIAVAAICKCWNAMTPGEIETAAADLLRRQLCPHGHFLDEGV